MSVSVIVAVRNGERFLADALRSIVAQTYTPLEVIVVDGGSSDRTAGIARTFPGVRVVAQVGRGIAAAYNQGIALARGDLIAFLSHDDLWRPGKLATHVARMTERPDLAFTNSHVCFFLERGDAVPAGFRPQLLRGEHPARIMETLVARRSLFDRIGVFDPALEISEDVDWYARAQDAGVASEMIARALVDKRVHRANTSLHAVTQNRDLLLALRRSIVRKRAAASTVPTPTISVVIPVRDGERFLREAITSALEQTLSPHEVIVVDDGSRDDSAAVAEALGPPVVCLRQGAAGAGAARNRGAELATGEFIAFLDADDLWPYDKLAIQAAAFRAEPALDVVFGHVVQFPSPELTEAEQRAFAYPPAALPGPLPGTMLIRRSAWRRVGPFRTDVMVGETLDWYARAADAGLKMTTLTATLLRRRLHRTNRAIDRRSHFPRVLRDVIHRRRRADPSPGRR